MPTRNAKRSTHKRVSTVRKQKTTKDTIISVRTGRIRKAKATPAPVIVRRRRGRSAEAIRTSTAFLHAHGIDVPPTRLDEMVATAVAALPKTLYVADPRQDLTAVEQETLAGGGFDLSSRSLGGRDPLVQATAEFAALMKTSKSVQELANILGVHQSRIRQRLNAEPPSLYGFKVEGEWRIPAFILEGRRLVRGIDRVAARLDSGLHPVGFYRWFTTPNPDLEAEEIAGDRPLSPRSWLESGLDPEPVAELASHL